MTEQRLVTDAERAWGTQPDGLLIRDVCIEGVRGLDVRIEGGRIVEIGSSLRASVSVLEGRGGVLLPGLHDHHIHLLALAARKTSVSVGPDDVAGPHEFQETLRAAARRIAAGAWLRATDYHDSVTGALDRDVLDRIVNEVPLRVQYRTGSLWVLNSAALQMVLPATDWPTCVECDAKGRPTGRIWRGDDWLRSRLRSAPPSLTQVGADLARGGITAVTDASVTTTAAEADILAKAVHSGDLPLRLNLMSGGELAPPHDGTYAIGPVKIVLDDHDLGDFDAVITKIEHARAWERRVAVHCVTAGELAYALAAFAAAGSVPGDRIEHGGVIDGPAADEIARLGLTVVTQPSFVFERGDSYLAEVDAADRNHLYRCASLLRAGIKVAGSTDAPYSAANPWAAVAAAVRRRTRRGQPIGEHEALSLERAVQLFLGSSTDPGGPRRRVEPGVAADLCLLRGSLESTLADSSHRPVAATIVAGRVTYALT